MQITKQMIYQLLSVVKVLDGVVRFQLNAAEMSFTGFLDTAIGIK